MEDSIVADSEVTWLADFLLSVSVDDISENDANIAFYVCSYIERSITRRRDAHHENNAGLKRRYSSTSTV